MAAATANGNFEHSINIKHSTETSKLRLIDTVTRRDPNGEQNDREECDELQNAREHLP